jgi:YD repeat-containing protein
MGRAEPEPLPAAARTAAYIDAEGRPTDDPEAAVRGEIVEYDGHGRLRRRTRFFLAEHELPWLPVSEPAFLLWVLVALMVFWLGIGLVLFLT